MKDVILSVALSVLFFVSCHGTTPAPNTDSAPCSLTVWNRATLENVTKTKINVREGAMVSLSCEYRCPGAEEGYPPELEWLGPRYTRIRSIRGRIFVVDGDSRRMKLLYVQSVSAGNIGVYTCHVKGGHQSAHAELDMEVQAEEFTNLDLSRGEDKRPDDMF